LLLGFLGRAVFFVVVFDLDDAFLVEFVVDGVELVVVLAVFGVFEVSVVVFRIFLQVAFVACCEGFGVFGPASEERMLVGLEHLHEALVLQELVVFLLELNH